MDKKRPRDCRRRKQKYNCKRRVNTFTLIKLSFLSKKDTGPSCRLISLTVNRSLAALIFTITKIDCSDNNTGFSQISYSKIP